MPDVFIQSAVEDLFVLLSQDASSAAAFRARSLPTLLAVLSAPAGRHAPEVLAVRLASCAPSGGHG